MSYREEFPDFDFEVPALVSGSEGWEDISWANDSCPLFECDVFVLGVDYADRTKREFPFGAQFTMQHEGEVMLQTDSWEDVRAFIEDGRRDFPPYAPPAPIVVLTADFAAFVQREGLPAEGDALDLLQSATLTPEQRKWLGRFVAIWEEEAANDPQFYDKLPLA